MNLLVVATPDDPHANAVLWGVGRLGEQAALFDYASLPLAACMTYASEGDAFRVEGSDRINLNEIDCLWVRRPAPAVVGPDVHPNDRRYAEISWQELSSAFGIVARNKCRLVVNDPVAYSGAASKTVQLSTAASVGLPVPRTVITNSAEEAVGFIDANDRDGARTVVKGFVYMRWETASGAILNAPTTIVTREDVYRSDVRSCPMIFQRFVEKAFEVRIVVCGRSYVAARIAPQAGRGAVDWRMERAVARLGCERIAVPDTVLVRIFGLMDLLGIVSSSMDFIVDADGTWTFVESNEGGNWAWLEAVNPELPVLDMFCRFLVSCDSRFVYDGRRRLTMREFHSERDQGSTPGGPRPLVNRGTAPELETP